MVHIRNDVMVEIGVEVKTEGQIKVEVNIKYWTAVGGINVRDQIRVQVKTGTHIRVELRLKNQFKMVKVKVRDTV